MTNMNEDTGVGVCNEENQNDFSQEINKKVSSFKHSKKNKKDQRLSSRQRVPLEHITNYEEATSMDHDTDVLLQPLMLKSHENVIQKRADTFRHVLQKSIADEEECRQYDHFYRPMITDCLIHGTQLNKDSIFLHVGSGSGLFGQALSSISHCISLGIEGKSDQHVQSAKRLISFYKLNFWRPRYLSIGPQNITDFLPVTHVYIQIIHNNNTSTNSTDQEIETVAKMFNESKTCKYLLILQNRLTPIQVKFKVQQNAIMTYYHNKHTKLVLRIFHRINDTDDGQDTTQRTKTNNKKFQKKKESSIMTACKILGSNDKSSLITHYRNLLQKHVELKKEAKQSHNSLHYKKNR